MSPTKRPAAEVPCDPEWIQAVKFYWYCAKAAPNHVNRDKVTDVDCATWTCPHIACLFKKGQ